MVDQEPQLLDVGAGKFRRRIAVRVLPPQKPGAPVIVWLIGLKSDMMSTKAEALAAWCQGKGYGLTRFDYSGHGQSSGRFEDATTSDWLEETEAVFHHKTGAAPVVLVGSSTGAHVALLLLRQLLGTGPEAAKRILGLMLIAPAWDVTEMIWNSLSPQAQLEIMEKGAHDAPSDYGEPYRITKKFIEDGRKNLFSGAHFNPGRPVMVLQGLQDQSVSPAHTQALANELDGDWVEITQVADGEHRLSRPQDLEKIFALIERIIHSN